jgi:diguanylate cyclase (GGDEF)-like protein
VIDNFEHLLDGTILLLELLREAPGLKIVVTSQKRLSYQASQTLELKGLPYPSEGDANWEHFPAIELFLDRARRNQPDFRMAAEDIPCLMRICQSVAGLPLGLELAAAGLRVYSCQKIAEELAHNLDILATTMQDVPERQRSLRAAFDHSWALLNDREKDALRRLSIYQGEFSIDDAVATTGASIGVISQLVDRSLIQKNSSGYYLIQPVLRQYAVEKLDEIYVNEQPDRELSFSDSEISLTRDPVTGLPNRVLFRDLLKQALAVGRRQRKYVALLIVEIEGIHTLKGQISVDELKPIVRKASEVLSQTVRESDTVAHLAFGKFAIILEGMTQYLDGVVVMQKIRENFAKASIELSDDVRAGVHMGISVFPDDSEELSELLRMASGAMQKVRMEKEEAQSSAYEKPVYLPIDN